MPFREFGLRDFGQFLGSQVIGVNRLSFELCGVAVALALQNVLWGAF